MIDPTTETLVSMADAARPLPRRRGGKKPHVSCFLESIQVGGTRCTSKEALGRFFKALTNANLPTAQQPSTSRQRAGAERELERQGI